RGEWAEFNPWQVPMGQATPKVLEAMGVLVQRSNDPGALASDVDAALRLAYSTYSPVAVLLSQKLLGAKTFGGKK
ncbi:MAG: phosphonopyruvate decarboxylase, partial [Deinococcus sp.]